MNHNILRLNSLSNVCIIFTKPEIKGNNNGEGENQTLFSTFFQGGIHCDSSALLSS